MQKKFSILCVVFLLLGISGCMDNNAKMQKEIETNNQDVEEVIEKRLPLDINETIPPINDSKTTSKDMLSVEETAPTPQEEMLSDEEKIWRNRIEAAMAQTSCPDVPNPQFPSEYYQGPLIDAHLHIPAIPDWSEEDEEFSREEAPEGRFGGQMALLGWNVKMSEIACTLKQEGTYRNFAFFPAYEEIPEQLLEIASRTMEQYPDLFTPFIMSSGNDGEPNGFPTVDAAALKAMLDLHPDLFLGYGEIGLYERENGGSPALPPDSKRLEEIYPLITKHSLVVYFHPGQNQLANFKRTLKQHPDIIFIVHGDEIQKDILDLMEEYPNIYYGIDGLWGADMDLFHLFVGDNKQEYLKTMEREFDSVLAYEVRKWKPIIEKRPDRFLWGMDRGDAVWNYDLEVGQIQVKFARAFIGKLKPEAQESIAYKYAERLIEER